jgi:olefin beta-lactone synthetase
MIVNIVELLDEAADRNPEAMAIIEGRAGAERATSFQELRERSRRIATLLAGNGVGGGDGLVILVPMSSTLYAVIAAALRLGAVPVFVDPRDPAPQLALCGSGLPLRGIVVTPMACLWRLLTPSLRAITPVFVSHGHFPGAVPLFTSSRVSPWAAGVPCRPC